MLGLFLESDWDASHRCNSGRWAVTTDWFITVSIEQLVNSVSSSNSWAGIGSIRRVVDSAEETREWSPESPICFRLSRWLLALLSSSSYSIYKPEDDKLWWMSTVIFITLFRREKNHEVATGAADSDTGLNAIVAPCQSSNGIEEKSWIVFRVINNNWLVGSSTHTRSPFLW